MTQLPPMPPSGPSPAYAVAAAPASSGTSTLAVIALVLGVIGLCVPGFGLFAIILGVVVLARAGSGGRGLATAAIIVGVLGILFSVLMVGLSLPALSKARSMSRQIQSSVSMQMISATMISSGFDGETDGVVDYNLETQLAVPVQVWVPAEPIPSGVGTAYLLVVPSDQKDFTSLMPQLPLLVENPKAFSRDQLNVAYADGSVRAMPREDATRILDSYPGKIYNTDGTRWKP